MAAEDQILSSLKYRLRTIIPRWVNNFCNIDKIIDDNAEVIINWLRNEKQNISRL